MGIVLRTTDRITGEDGTLKRMTVSTEELDAQLPGNLLLPPSVSLHVRRSVLEMLENVTCHVEATTVRLRQHLADGCLLAIPA